MQGEAGGLRSSPQVPQMMTPATVRLIAGSIECQPVSRTTAPARPRQARRPRPRHVQEGAADVEIVLAASQEKKSGGGVDGDAAMAATPTAAGRL